MPDVTEVVEGTDEKVAKAPKSVAKLEEEGDIAADYLEGYSTSQISMEISISMSKTVALTRYRRWQAQAPRRQRWRSP